MKKIQVYNQKLHKPEVFIFGDVLNHVNRNEIYNETEKQIKVAIKKHIIHSIIYWILRHFLRFQLAISHQILRIK